MDFIFKNYRIRYALYSINEITSSIFALVITPASKIARPMIFNLKKLWWHVRRLYHWHACIYLSIHKFWGNQNCFNIIRLIFCSPELFLSKFVHVINFSCFHLCFLNYWISFNQTWYKLCLSKRWFKFVQMKGHVPFQLGNSTCIRYLKNLKKHLGKKPNIPRKLPINW